MSITGFWRETKNIDPRIAISSVHTRLNKVHYIAPQGGGPKGSYASFTALAPYLQSRDLVILLGVLREQAVAPLNVYDVAVLGAANRPRQATSGGVPTGGGASWLAPSSGAVAATPLIELKAQGWQFENIQFSPHTSSACVRLTRSAVTDTIDASHAIFRNCYFVGGTTPIGIEDNGGCGFVLVEECRFQALTSAILSLNTAAAIPLQWEILRNKFRSNTNDIRMSLTGALIEENKFFTVGSGSTNKVISTTFISTQGGANHILRNFFNNTEAEIAPGNGYTGAATDLWLNYVRDQAALAIGQPA